jgi:beta-mannosidase
MTAGPWRTVRLETYDLWTEIEVSEDLKRASGTLFTKVEGASDKVVFSMKLDGKAVLSKEAKVGSDGLAKAEVSIEDPELWYPHGYGAQNLYDISVEILRDNFVLDALSKRTGLRRGELVQDDDDIGQSFYFRINNIDIFCAGSCWIPADNFIPRLDECKYRKWLETMIDGHQVMTRYEKLKFHGPATDIPRSLGRRHL